MQKTERVTDEMVDAGLAEYAEGGCMGLDDRERREVVTAIIEAAAAALSSAEEKAVEVEKLNGNRPIPYDRDTLGRFVREAWVRWAEMQPSPKPSWLLPYDELSEADKEADRQIGETVARWTLIGDAARSALVDVPAVEEPVALIEREVLAELAKHKTATGTVCSPLFKSKFGDKVPLYAHPPHSSLIQSEEGKITLTVAEAEKLAARLEFDASWDKCGDGYYSIKNQLLALSTPPSPYGGDNGDGAATGTSGTPKTWGEWERGKQTEEGQ